MLHHLEGGTEDSTTDVGVRVENVSAEAVEPALEVAALGDERLLVLEVGVDLVQLVLDELGILGLVADTGEDLAGLVLLALADEETGGLGEEQQAGTQDQGPQHLEGDGDAVGAGVGAVLGAVVDAGGQKQTDRDAELVARDNGTADLAGSDLRHVQDDDGGDEADTESCDQTTGDEQAQGGRRSLQDDTNDEDNTAADDGGPTAEPVSQVTGDEGTEEGTGREDRDDERRFPGGENDLVRGRVWVLSCRG